MQLLVAGTASDSKLSFAAQQRLYGSLKEHGVHIWEYDRMVHAKSMVIDDDVVFIGSNNLDPLSLEYLDELVLVMRDPLLAKNMTELYEKDLLSAKAK